LLVKEYKLTYQRGKGNNHPVPVLFKSDINMAMQKLCISSDSIRVEYTKRMFTCFRTQNTTNHVCGWHVVHHVSIDPNIESPELQNPTKMRHMVSALYAARDVLEKDRQLFYMHMGHSEKVNSSIYQAPLSQQEITNVGFHLKEIEKCKHSFTSLHFCDSVALLYTSLTWQR